MSEDREPSLSELIESLAALSGKFEGLLERAIAIGVAKIECEDHLVIAALRRALDNVMGMLAMADQKNPFCGLPILRFQMDTAMTLFGRTIVKNVDAYVTHMMEGKKRVDFQDRDGERMTDNYLHKKLTKKYDDASKQYAYISGYVHFSEHHLFRVIDRDLWESKKELQ